MKLNTARSVAYRGKGNDEIWQKDGDFDGGKIEAELTPSLVAAVREITMMTTPMPIV